MPPKSSLSGSYAVGNVSESSVDKNLLCRFNKPGAQIHHTKKYNDDYENFINTAPETAGMYRRLVKRASEIGIQPSENKNAAVPGRTYRAPIGAWMLKNKQTTLLPIPWLGELCVEDSNDDDPEGKKPLEEKLHWRGYFLDLRKPEEAETEIDDVLMSRLLCKRGRSTALQNSQINEAIKQAKLWVGNHTNFALRLWEAP